jgi:hypothetical protein
MLDALKEKLISTLTAESLKSTFGNRAAIEKERRNFYAEIVGRLFPDIKRAADEEVSVVRDHLLSAEREVLMATDDVKKATGIVFKATETLLASLDAVHDAEAKIVDSQNAIIRAEKNLANAKQEFEKLVSRVRG